MLLEAALTVVIVGVEVGGSNPHLVTVSSGCENPLRVTFPRTPTARTTTATPTITPIGTFRERGGTSPVHGDGVAGDGAAGDGTSRPYRPCGS
jgi:hypothetical protein